eukprot:scaffold347_cov380-Prasinococcus_capsulatus_cf.AAC.33
MELPSVLEGGTAVPRRCLASAARALSVFSRVIIFSSPVSIPRSRLASCTSMAAPGPRWPSRAKGCAGRARAKGASTAHARAAPRNRWRSEGSVCLLYDRGPANGSAATEKAQSRHGCRARQAASCPARVSDGPAEPRVRCAPSGAGARVGGVPLSWSCTKTTLRGAQRQPPAGDLHARATRTCSPCAARTHACAAVGLLLRRRPALQVPGRSAPPDGAASRCTCSRVRSCWYAPKCALVLSPVLHPGLTRRTPQGVG